MQAVAIVLVAMASNKTITRSPGDDLEASHVGDLASDRAPLTDWRAAVRQSQ